MKRYLGLAVVCLVFAPVFAPAADPKPEDLLGKWELTEAVAGIPKAAVFDFQKEGKLVVTADVDGAKKTFDMKYELKGATLRLTVGEKTDSPPTLTFSTRRVAE